MNYFIAVVLDPTNRPAISRFMSRAVNMDFAKSSAPLTICIIPDLAELRKLNITEWDEVIIGVQTRRIAIPNIGYTNVLTDDCLKTLTELLGHLANMKVKRNIPFMMINDV